MQLTCFQNIVAIPIPKTPAENVWIKRELFTGYIWKDIDIITSPTALQ